MTPAPLALRTLLLVLLGQASASPNEPAAAYHVGPGDVMEVTVAGRPDLARLPTVQTTGLIWIPEVPKGVRVEGSPPSEIGKALTELLARHEPARPEVTVSVKEYRSQFVWMAGEVNQPGRKALKGPMRLLDALREAGGFTARASGEGLLQRQEGTLAGAGPVRPPRVAPTAPTPARLPQAATAP